MSAFWLLFVAIGILAAASDVASYKIPNAAVITLGLLFFAAAAFHPAQTRWLDHLGAGGLALVVGIAFYMFKQMGAGDAKLLAACALWSGFSAIVMLMFCIACASLVQLAAIMWLRWLTPLMQQYYPKLYGAGLPRVLVKGEVVPLGVGISLGAIVASHWFSPLLWPM
jgi:prepilin peptidase CpaA